MPSPHFARDLVTLAVIAMALTGCVSTHYVEKPEEVFASSPVITTLSKKTYETRTPPGDVALYYFTWNALTRPDAVKDWEKIYVMGEASSPDWDFERIAHVAVAKRRKDDAAALVELRDIVSRAGGDAIVDLRRDPMIDAPKFGSKIIGYRYLGTVVRRKDP